MPYGQVLARWDQQLGRIDRLVNDSRQCPGFSQEESATNFALEVGGGVNFGVTENAGIRFGVDYLRVFAEDEGSQRVPLPRWCGVLVDQFPTPNAQ